MRVKQTAKKITAPGEEIDNNSIPIDQEDCSNTNDNNPTTDTVNGISDNEVEFVVECRRDTEGNQFLLDGTLVIEPAPVSEAANQTEPKPKSNQLEEIGFSQFIQDLQLPPNADKCVSGVAGIAFATIGNQSAIRKSASVSGPAFSSPQVSVKCTACNAKFNPFIGNSLHQHPVLAVILCKDCIENQKDKYFIIDEEDNKETLCRWCVEGGSLICCDFCSKSYCKTCIKRNLGRTVLSEILNQDDSVQWKCFSCDPTPIKMLQEAYTKIYNDICTFNESRRKAQNKINKKPIQRLDTVNKKRSISKAFPPTTPKIVSVNQPINPNLNTLNLLNNMEGFGTEWYIRNVNMESILTGIDRVDSRTLLNAINSSKKCIEAFYSDIRNLENEISKAASSTDIMAIVSMFKSVYRHHIFNRFCQIQSRIEEDKKTRFVPQTVNGNYNKKETNSAVSTTPSLMINSVMSTAVAPPNVTVKRMNNTFTPNLIAKGIRQMSNGDRKSLPIMYSIDLTDDTDRNESPVKKPNIEIPMEDVPEEEEDVQGKPKEIVDLCNDDDSTSISSYPVVRMNFNNQLFGANNS